MVDVMASLPPPGNDAPFSRGSASPPPDDWRRATPDARELIPVLLDSDLLDGWTEFKRWCDSSDESAFPSSPSTLLRFIASRAIGKPDIRYVLEAVARLHEAIFWHSDADPVAVLNRAGVDVTDTGEVLIPVHVAEQFGLN